MRETRSSLDDLWVRSVTGAVALLLIGGCGALRRPDPPIDRSHDARILSELRERLESEPEVDASRIRVEVDGAIVILYGSVEGIAEWRCAIRNAQLVEGVATVVDNLVLERGPREGVCVAERVEGPPGDGSQHAPRSE